MEQANAQESEGSNIQKPEEQAQGMGLKTEILNGGKDEKKRSRKGIYPYLGLQGKMEGE